MCIQNAKTCNQAMRTRAGKTKGILYYLCKATKTGKTGNAPSDRESRWILFVHFQPMPLLRKIWLQFIRASEQWCKSFSPRKTSPTAVSKTAKTATTATFAIPLGVERQDVGGSQGLWPGLESILSKGSGSRSVGRSQVMNPVISQVWSTEIRLDPLHFQYVLKTSKGLLW